MGFGRGLTHRILNEVGEPSSFLPHVIFEGVGEGMDEDGRMN